MNASTDSRRRAAHRMNAYWRARKLPLVGQIYLYDNPLLKEPLKLSHVKPMVVGHWGTTPGQSFIYVHLNRVITKFDLEHVLHRGSGSRRTGAGRQHVPGRLVERALPQHQPGRDWPEETVQAVLVSRRHLEPRRADDTRLDSRGRRARVLAQPRFRSRFRQSGAGRGLHHRRRRGRDRTTGHRVALQQAARPRDRRSRSADPSPQRLQDQQPDHSGAHRARGVGAVPTRLRMDAVLRRRSRAGGHAPAHGGDPRPGHPRTSGASRRARGRRTTRLGPAGR